MAFLRLPTRGVVALLLFLSPGLDLAASWRWMPLLADRLSGCGCHSKLLVLVCLQLRDDCQDLATHRQGNRGAANAEDF